MTTPIVLPTGYPTSDAKEHYLPCEWDDIAIGDVIRITNKDKHSWSYNLTVDEINDGEIGGRGAFYRKSYGWWSVERLFVPETVEVQELWGQWEYAIADPQREHSAVHTSRYRPEDAAVRVTLDEVLAFCDISIRNRLAIEAVAHHLSFADFTYVAKLIGLESIARILSPVVDTGIERFKGYKGKNLAEGESALLGATGFTDVKTSRLVFLGVGRDDERSKSRIFHLKLRELFYWLMYMPFYDYNDGGWYKAQLDPNRTTSAVDALGWERYLELVFAGSSLEEIESLMQAAA